MVFMNNSIIKCKINGNDTTRDVERIQSCRYSFSNSAKTFLNFLSALFNEVVISLDKASGSGKLSKSVRLSSFSQNISRLALSRFTISS